MGKLPDSPIKLLNDFLCQQGLQQFNMLAYLSFFIGWSLSWCQIIVSFPITFGSISLLFHSLIGSVNLDRGNHWLRPYCSSMSISPNTLDSVYVASSLWNWIVSLCWFSFSSGRPNYISSQFSCPIVSSVIQTLQCTCWISSHGGVLSHWMIYFLFLQYLKCPFGIVADKVSQQASVQIRILVCHNLGLPHLYNLSRGFQ